MKLKFKYLAFIAGASLLGSIAHATENYSLPVVGTKFFFIRTADHGYKLISINRVQPSNEFLLHKLKPGEEIGKEKDYSGGITPFSQSPGAVDLGMNNTPVLDQGQYGTCVTFASTAALDAILGQGDFIDQQCTLELNTGLGNDYWDGANAASQIIDPLKQYGLVQKGGCDNQYPVPYMSIDTTTYETLISSTVNVNNINYNYVNNMPLSGVKAALNAGNRVTIGFGLLANNNDQISVQGFDMTIGGQQTTGGLWACHQPSSHANYCGTPAAGHDVVVIGYDDKQQLLKIRNSWDTAVGDDGDFYMTYTFFAKMNGDGTAISGTP